MPRLGSLVALEFARRNRVNPIWREHKRQWDCKTPRKNSKAFAAYAESARIAQESTQRILDEVIADLKAADLPI